ncbi:MAG TPA: nucleotidyltransferase domain-containing protein [Terracidiphilus sp.]|nr:nucleotidyltransferase domain-containing protein [Terracidiphilus sp.]
MRISETEPGGGFSVIAAHQPELVKLCQEFHVLRLELFGSAVRGDFDPAHSDLDFLVEFEPLPAGAYATAFFGFKEALEQLFGNSVDLVVPSAVRNPYFRQSIERGKALLYAA